MVKPPKQFESSASLCPHRGMWRKSARCWTKWSRASTGPMVKPGVRLEVWKWETHVVPQIGPKPQGVVDNQTPAHYDIYLGIMKHRFGTPTERYGSGTEKEFNDALERWGKEGSPWVLFYFTKEKVNHHELDDGQYEQYCGRFASIPQEDWRKWGFMRLTRESGDRTRGSLKRSRNICGSILQLLAPLGPQDEDKPVADPTAYLRDLLTKTEYIDIRGLQVGQERAHRFPIEELYISLTTTQAASLTATSR